MFSGASSHCYLGGFYNVAPWPLKDQKKALVEMRAAAALEPRSRRNQYYVCVVELQLGNLLPRLAQPTDAECGVLHHRQRGVLPLADAPVDAGGLVVGRACAGRRKRALRRGVASKRTAAEAVVTQQSTGLGRRAAPSTRSMNATSNFSRLSRPSIPPNSSTTGLHGIEKKEEAKPTFTFRPVHDGAASGSSRGST